MIREEVRPDLVFMDKVKPMMDPVDRQKHMEAYADYKRRGVHVVVYDTESEAAQAAEDYRRRGLTTGRSADYGTRKSMSGGGGNRVNTFMVATKLEPENFTGWNAEELATLSDPVAAMGTMFKRVCAASPDVEVESCYGIVHDKDTETFRDINTNEDFTLPTDAHVHLTAKFAGGRSKGLTVAAIAAALGLPENMVERGKSGRYAADNFQAYLIHAKDRQKHQYSPRDVITFAGDDYLQVWSARISAWERGASTKSRKAAVEDVDWLIDKARFGEVSRDDILSDKTMFNIYSVPANKTKVDIALQAWMERRMALAAAAMDRHEFSTTVVFIYGRPGIGKSVCVKALEAYLRDTYGWDAAKLAASNAMDEYAGQDIIELDDARGGAMSAEDWLKLLDPYTANAASARYQNKVRVAPKVVVIVSNKDPLEFFYYARNVGGGDRSEVVDTFFRRLQWYVKVLNPYDVGLYNYEMLNAQRVEPYGRCINTGRDIEYLRGLTYDFRDVEPDTRFSPYGAIEMLARYIDKRSAKGVVADRDDSEETFARAAQYVHEEMALPVAEQKLPALPAPSGALPAKRVDVSPATSVDVSIEIPVDVSDVTSVDVSDAPNEVSVDGPALLKQSGRDCY